MLIALVVEQPDLHSLVRDLVPLPQVLVQSEKELQEENTMAP